MHFQKKPRLQTETFMFHMHPGNTILRVLVLYLLNSEAVMNVSDQHCPNYNV